MQLPEHHKLLRTKALADSTPLVRACVSEGPWQSDDQLSCLLFARRHSTTHFIVGLKKTFDHGSTDDNTLSDCLRELLENPTAKHDLQYNGEYAEGDIACYQGELVSAGWDLVRKAGPKVSGCGCALIAYSPISVATQTDTTRTSVHNYV